MAAAARSCEAPTMPLWIAATLAACSFQAVRFLLQKRMSGGGLGPVAATFARFVYAPVALGLGLLIWRWSAAAPMPTLREGFWPFAVAGAVSQILATVLVVATFSRRNFAVGIALSKTTVLMTVATGAVLLGEVPRAAALAAIVVGVVGVLLVSVPRGVRWRAGLADRAVLYGLGAGALFAVSGVSYRGASLAVASEAALVRAAATLFFVTSVQTVVLALWMLWRDRAALRGTFRRWRMSLAIGATSMLGSLAWFTAYTLEQAALVNAVGQVELILSLLISATLLGERVSGREVAGTGLIGLSVAVILFAP